MLIERRGLLLFEAHQSCMAPIQEHEDNGIATFGCRIIGARFNLGATSVVFKHRDNVSQQAYLTDGKKRLYERGVRWPARNGVSGMPFPTMAEALGNPRAKSKTICRLGGKRA